MPPEGCIYIIDDDDAARESLAFLIRSAGLAVQTYSDPRAFLDDVALVRSGCIITDVRMPHMDGIELLRRLRKCAVMLPVIVVTGHGDIPLAVEAIRSGAIDFLEKPFDGNALLDVVHAALKRREEEDLDNAERSTILARIESLSARERQVLEGLVAGQPNKVIAYDLGISIRTIEIYRANVMTKMEATSLSDLVRMAIVGGVSKPRRSAVA
jgi:two-component system, LuxR family, response regulator FixJ